jgi:uncharacterized RDD family membrane protein YckC
MDPNNSSIFEDLEASMPIRYASPGQRFLNYLIDILIYYAVLIFLTVVFSALGLGGFMISTDIGSKVLQYLYAIAVFVLLYGILETGTKGRTIGKYITGTRAVQEDGRSAITSRQAFIRSICRMIPFEPFSAFSGNAWHDSIPKTTVVKTR